MIPVFRLLFLLALALTAAPAHAQEALFSSEVKAEATAADPLQAREQAIARAKKQGFDEVVARLSPEQKEKIIRETDDAELAALIRGVEILEERISGKTWRGRIKITYDALPISGLLEQRVSSEGIPESAERSPAMVVIPAYEENGARQLWEPENPWASVWRQVALERHGGFLIVPYGDNIDAAPVTAAAVDTAAYPAFAPLVARYGAGTLMVVKAEFAEEPRPHLTVTKRLITRTRDESARMEYAADPIEDKNALFKRAALDLAEQMDRLRAELLAQQAFREKSAGSVNITVPMSRIESWIRIRALIGSLPSVAQVEEIAVAPRRVQARIHFRGEREDLAKGISSKGLRVNSSSSNWVIADE